MNDFPDASDYRQQCLSQFLQEDGRTMILPMDHPIGVPVAGLEKPGAVIESLSEWADGYVVNLGIARACAASLKGKGICLRTDSYNVRAEGPGAGSLALFDTHDALAVGAHAVMNMTFPGGDREADILAEAADLISGSLQTGVPVIIEALPVGLGQADAYTPENVAFAVRQAAELGADIVKTTFPTNGTESDFRAIVEACPVPVVVLGGAAMGDDEALLEMVSTSISAGAAGIAIGRNVWQHADPPGILSQLHAIVHA